MMKWTPALPLPLRTSAAWTAWRICNVGIRPTFQKSENNLSDRKAFKHIDSKYLTNLEDKNIIEVHIFNFNKNIYKKHIKVTFLNKIREEKIFSNSSELSKQIESDTNIAQRMLSSKKVLKTLLKS